MGRRFLSEIAVAISLAQRKQSEEAPLWLTFVNQFQRALQRSAPLYSWHLPYVNSNDDYEYLYLLRFV